MLVSVTVQLSPGGTSYTSTKTFYSDVTASRHGGLYGFSDTRVAKGFDFCV